MKSLIIHGQLDKKFDATDLPKSFTSMAAPKFSAKLQRARAGHPPRRLPQLNPEDIVQLELEDGIVLWLRADRLEADLGLTSTRGGEMGELELPAVLPIGSASRGLGNWILKGLKIFEGKLVDSTTNIIKEKVEGILKPGPGLYRWHGKDVSGYHLVDKQLPSGREHAPWLVFLHGTASSCDGSFGGLWEDEANARMRVLQKQYKNRVLAFQHRTLSQDPIQNAINLITSLPKGVRLHLVSHSRGGLIGELLCRSMSEGRFPFGEEDFGVFADVNREEDCERLKELSARLQEKQLNIERFVRVGCPARGTTLASGRLDRYLSIIFNVLRFVPGLKANPIYEGITSFIAAVVKNRTDPTELPGLEAQMPDSPLIQILNRPGVPIRADLHILGGDVAGSGVLGRLKAFVTDLFYREDHDLVVNTPAMFGGAERTGPIRYWIDTGKKVDHFSYFRNPDTANRLLQVLTKEENTDVGFHVLDVKPSEVEDDDYRKRATNTPEPLVFVIPGTMGSHLKVQEQGDWDRIWLDKWELVKGGLTKLKHDAKHVQADKPIGSGYKDLMKYLSHSHKVEPFAYDWRKSLIELSEAFRQKLEQALEMQEEVGQPVRIIAHSMGGLVVRVMISTTEGRKAWDRMCQHPGARFIMLGTPNGGSHAITAMLMGRDPLVRQLAFWDFTNSQTELLGIISRYDGVLNLLPHDGPLDVFTVDTWEALLEQDRGRLDKEVAAKQARGGSGKKIATSKTADIDWPIPKAEQLAKAMEVRDLIKQSHIDPQRMLYVAGKAEATPCLIRFDHDSAKDRRVRIEATAAGDGRVPWATGIPDELQSKTYFTETEHGSLASDESIFDALYDLLNAGNTTKLPKTAPVSRGVSVKPFEYQEVSMDIYPNEEDVIASALGASGSPMKKTKATLPQVTVSVVHGNLSRAVSPVAVGHYDGDSIVSAEAYLDRQLDGRLRERQALGLYPEAIGSSAVVLGNREPQKCQAHPGAIVMGLGGVGTLTPGGLTRTVADALVQYAVQCFDEEQIRRRRDKKTQWATQHLSLAATSLLIGTGAGGMRVSDSLQAILRGVSQANDRLQSLAQAKGQQGKIQGEPQPFMTVAIETIEILELYEDRAIQALKALLAMGRTQEFRKTLSICESLVEGVEGRRRASFEEEEGWWQRLRISTDRDGTLKFEAPTNRARSVTYLQPTQQKLIDRFLRQAIASTRNDQELSSTLFEYMIPNDMKDYAPDQQNMILEVDEQSAGYPWELLHDRLGQQAKPLSVAAGMVRQMVTKPDEFRKNVRQSYEWNALVIGDPTSQDSSRQFSPLPGAAAEAREVAHLFRRQNYRRIVELVEADATSDAVLTELYARPYRIVHCAAHGVFEYPLNGREVFSGNQKAGNGKTVTGMALGEELFLTPNEIEQMRYVPELVFLNCCHLGHVTINGQAQVVPFHRLAANLGTQLIRMGVQVVVAAGWSVDDAAAKVFATVFYDEMFRGSPFGEAVRRAREEIYLQFGDTNTWGAYQCYGDPDFSFSTESTPAAQRFRFVAPVELRVELLNCVQAAKSANPSDIPGLLEWVKMLEGKIGESWQTSASLCAALGQAFCELKQFPEAVRYLEQSRKLEPADAPVESLQQLANAKVRWAQARMERQQMAQEVYDQSADCKVRKQSALEEKFPIPELFSDAAKILDGLLQIHPSQERWALRGRVSKGLAMIEEERESGIKALVVMSDCYQKGYEFGKATKRKDVYYPLQNWLAADIIRSWDLSPSSKRSRKSKKTKSDQEISLHESIEVRLSELKGYAEQFHQTGQTFWDMVVQPDQQLLDAMFRRSLPAKKQQEIAKGYLEGQKRGGSPMNMDSVLKNIAFFETMLLSAALPKKVQKDLKSGLEALRNRLDPGE